jgi:redox-sensitive bicupin YhaK (pirin superfamily)
MSLRAVKQILETKPTIEGAGVKLQRAFGFGKTAEFDPFLLLDDFRNPEVTEDDGTKARIICGEFWGKKGPVEGVAADPRYVDISVPPNTRRRIQVETTRNAFAYVFAGSGTFRDASKPQAVLTESAVDPNAEPVYDAKNHSLVLFDRGDEIVVQAGPEGIRFLLISGKPLEEPVAWYGPIVMNTQEQLRQAMAELHTGGFIKHR